MNFRFPSKTFLLGEYAILKGASALLLGHPPFFTAELEDSATCDAPFHPESLAGHWLKQHPLDYKIRLKDPHEARGGYGGSGAEFLAAWIGDKSVPAPHAPRAIFAWSAWEDSRSLPGSGSGADILTQAFGCDRSDPFFLEIDLEGRSLNEIYFLEGNGFLSLFHTGQKLATHSQPIPEKLPLQEMEELVFKAGFCLEKGQFQGFAQCVNSYGDLLASLGLAAPHTLKAVESARKVPHVLAAKGCGAMGSDVILIVHSKEVELDAWARENSLTLTLEFPV